MKVDEFSHIVWCDLAIVLLKIHSHSPWDTKMVSACQAPDQSRPTVNVFLCRDEDTIFDEPSTYRENMVRQGAYRGHHFGKPGRIKYIDNQNIALHHPDPGMIIWSLIVKYVLTVHAIGANVLHIKGGAVTFKERAFLFLGRGGSGKTEVIRALCRNGAGLVANTHLLVDGGSVCGIKSAVRIRDKGRDVYVPVSEQQNLDTHKGWLPIGGVFWVKYRTDGGATVEPLPPDRAKANMRYFSESISNWEIKEDIADYSESDPLRFAEQVNRVDKMLDRFCEASPIHYLSVDIFSRQGMDKLMSVMEAGPTP